MLETIVKNLVKEVNKLRLNNKNQWYYYTNTDYHFRIKGFETSIQMFQKNIGQGNSIHIPVGMSMTATEYKTFLKNEITDIVKEFIKNGQQITN